MDFQNNASTLLNHLSNPKRAKHLTEICLILENIPSLYKMMRIKGTPALKQLALKSEIITVHTNQQLFSQNTQSPIGFHLVIQGIMNVQAVVNLRNQEKEVRVVGTMKAGDTFGYTREYETFTIHKLVAIEKCSIMKINVNDMYKLLDGVFVFPELITRLEQLRRISIFKQLDKKDLLKIVEHSKRREYSIHQTIFKEGDEVENLLMLEKGEVQLYHVGKRMFRKQKFIDKLPICILVSQGDLLGLDEMMVNERYKCSAQSTSSSCALTLIPKNVIMLILKESKKQLKKQQPGQFKIQSKSRDNRIHTMIELSHKMNKKQEMIDIKKGRLCFEQKNKILSSQKQKQKSLTTRSSYFSNKFNDRIMFENEEEFYSHKIKKLERFATDRYGKQFKAKFVSLFGNDFLPPKKITKDLLFRKTARTYTTLHSARKHDSQSQSNSQERSMSCSFYRLKKKVLDTNNMEITKYTKTMNSWF